MAEKLAVEADNHRRSCLLGSVDHALQGFEVPTLEVADGISALLAATH